MCSDILQNPHLVNENDFDSLYIPDKVLILNKYKYLLITRLTLNNTLSFTKVQDIIPKTWQSVSYSMVCIRKRERKAENPYIPVFLFLPQQV